MHLQNPLFHIQKLIPAPKRKGILQRGFWRALAQAEGGAYSITRNANAYAEVQSHHARGAASAFIVFPRSEFEQRLVFLHTIRKPPTQGWRLSNRVTLRGPLRLSILTGSVQVVSILFTSSKVLVNLFDSRVNSLPDCLLVVSRTENAPLTGAIFCTRDSTGNRTPVFAVRG